MIRILRHWLAGASLTALAAGVALAQPQQQPTDAQPMRQTAQDDGVEVLARGPVHEAFAATTELPNGGPLVEKAPPDAIEELPPDQKPEGDNVQWIPGYWNFDDERKDFIWISGFWRVPPPGRIWVPGSWREVRGGFQWASGFWNAVDQKERQAEIEYLPQPPAPLEAEPSTPAPTDTSFSAPGSWVWRADRYAWRPPYWVEHRSDWVWIPDSYCWSPAGYIHIPGYWDYTPEARGVLFAPVCFRPEVLARPAFVYTPVCAVSHQGMLGALFVRRGHSSYYFGDYFEPRYVSDGYRPWLGAPGRRAGSAINIGRTASYDPLWSYYRTQNRDDPRWSRGLSDAYAGRTSGDLARPPRTLVQQNTVVDSITNVTNVNNVTNVSRAPAPLMLASLADVQKTNRNITLKAVSADDRRQEQKLARELTQVSVARRQAETSLVTRNAAAPAKRADVLRTAKFDVPEAARVRSEFPAANRPPALPTQGYQKPEGRRATHASPPPSVATPTPAATVVPPKPPVPTTSAERTPRPPQAPDTIPQKPKLLLPPPAALQAPAVQPIRPPMPAGPMPPASTAPKSPMPAPVLPGVDARRLPSPQNPAVNPPQRPLPAPPTRPAVMQPKASLPPAVAAPPQPPRIPGVQPRQVPPPAPVTPPMSPRPTPVAPLAQPKPRSPSPAPGPVPAPRPARVAQPTPPTPAPVLRPLPAPPPAPAPVVQHKLQAPPAPRPAPAPVAQSQPRAAISPPVAPVAQPKPRSPSPAPGPVPAPRPARVAQPTPPTPAPVLRPLPAPPPAPAPVVQHKPQAPPAPRSAPAPVAQPQRRAAASAPAAQPSPKPGEKKGRGKSG